MKSRMSANVSNSCLFLAVSFLMLCSLIDTSAQSRSASMNLEGTEWIGAQVTNAVGSATVTLQCSHNFEAKGRAVYRCLALQSPGTMAGTNLNDPMFLPGIDNPFKPKLVTTPGGSAMSESVGRYTQDGNSVRVEFADAIMNIIIKENVLSGETVYKDSSKGKEKWVMQKIQNNQSLKPTSSPFSLSEFQKTYFKPVPLTQNAISGTNLDGSLNYHNYSFIVDSGELTITLVLKASQDSFASQVSIEVQDRKNNVLGNKFITTARGRTDQAAISVNLSEKQAVLLKVRVFGGASYQIRLNGGLDFGQPALSPKRDALSEAHALLREESDRQITEAEVKERVAIGKLRTLDTYRAATEITYGATKISGNLLIKVIAVGSGQVVVEVVGEEGISLKGILTRAGFQDNELVLRGIVSIDFGTGLGPQKLDFTLGFTVENRALTKGRFYLGTEPDNVKSTGKFIRAELVTGN